MIYAIISGILAIAIFSGFCFIKRQIKLSKELEQKLSYFQSQIKVFFEEFTNLKSHYVPADEETNFVEKWRNLYSEISKFHIHKKNVYYTEIKNFKSAFKNIHKEIAELNAEIERRKNIEKVYEQLTAFFSELSEITNHYVSKKDIIGFKNKWSYLSNLIETADVHSEDKEYEGFGRFKKVITSLDSYFETKNNAFIQYESRRCDSLLSNINGKSLDEQQRAAVITDEDRILVLAGAGSGKTLTISAKVKYLCKERSVNPNDILLISFTRKSAEEMTERIQNGLGIPVTATTFHKLGLDIIKEADGKRPEVADEGTLNDFINDFFENKVINHPDLVKALTEYFTYFLEIPDNMEDYSSLGELYEEERAVDLETLKSKYDREKFILQEEKGKSNLLKTLKNETVKSIEETKIANFLFMHGVNYEYEKLYPYESDDPMRKAYHPDFYLTDYDIYLEHFGISKDWTVPWLSPVEEKKYLDGITWKREFHQKHGTKLIETYSYYASEGILLNKLEELLIANNVELKNRDFTDVFETVYASKSNKYFSEFIKLCCTFITLLKCNNYNEVLLNNYSSKEINAFMRERTNLFLDIIKIIITEYQNYLTASHSIDFSDMINNAAEKVQNGCPIISYKYVIVDEYQDISKSRVNFLKAIADRTNAKFFCVGDDWQSIYRFAGSDISLFTDFEKYFGYTKVLKIEKTYRNSQNLIDEASRFILQNPLQLKKELKSDKQLDYPLVFWGYDEEPKQILGKVINKIISEFGSNSSILLLGRTNFDKDIVLKSGLFRTVYKNRKEELEYLPVPDLPIEFLSVHKSKGLEADNVIILNFKNDKLGFPNQIADDKVLNLVLTSAEDFKFAEERRLFYVAITRTKNRTFVLTDNKNPSQFFKEFTESKSVCFVSIKNIDNSVQTKCPLCKTGNLLKVEHDGRYFIGCSNYPRCKYTLHNANILLNPKKCPSCGGFLVRREGKNKHWFSGCTNYPYCTYTEEFNKYK
jgi:DNA helicase-4